MFCLSHGFVQKFLTQIFKYHIMINFTRILDALFGVLFSMENRSFRYYKFITIVFINFVVLSTIINHNLSLTIVNEDRRREKPDLKGISTYH